MNATHLPLSVFLFDMKHLPNDVFTEFMHGNFTVKKAMRQFSAIGTDQAHEQTNKSVKVNGGAIGILQNEKALLEWSTASPIVAEILEDFNVQHDQDQQEQTTLAHHEDNKNFENNFKNDRSQLMSAFDKLSNPFSESSEDLINIFTRQVYPDESSTSVISAEEIGKNQSSLFINERLIKRTTSVHATIHRNNLSLFRAKKNKLKTKAQQHVRTLRERCQLYGHLYAACASRNVDLTNFFAHMNHEYPVALSDNGGLLKPSSKSDTIACIQSVLPEDCNQYSAPSVSACIVDGAAFVHMHPPRSAKTYGEYCDEITSAGVSLSERYAVERLDIVFDVFLPGSRKRETREARGSKSAVRISVQENTPILKDTKASAMSEKTLISTIHDGVVSNRFNPEMNHLQPCNKEEADDRMFLHVQNASVSGHRKISIITVDTDVVVIACYFSQILM